MGFVLMERKYTAQKGRKKLINLTEFDANQYASVGGWKVTGFKPYKRSKRRNGVVVITMSNV